MNFHTNPGISDKEMVEVLVQASTDGWMDGHIDIWMVMIMVISWGFVGLSVLSLEEMCH